MALTEVDAARLNDNVFNATGPFTNRIINGDMRIDQRNAGAAVTINSTANTYCVDRWFASGETSDGVFTVDQTTDAPAGFTNSTRITVTTADASIGSTQIYLFRQAIEGNNVYDLGFGTVNAKTFTFSFWVRSSLTGTFGGALNNSANNRNYPFTYSISAANTWEYKTVTAAGDTTGTWLTDTGRGLTLTFQIGAGSSCIDAAGSWTGTSGIYGATGATNIIGTLNATWDITGVQLEAGSVATPFERRSYGQELSLCQRYYEKSYNYATVPGSTEGDSAVVSLYGGSGSVLFQNMGGRWVVPKRAIPGSVTFYNPDNGTAGQTGNAVTITGSNLSETGWRISFASQQYPRVHYSCDAEL